MKNLLQKGFSIVEMMVVLTVISLLLVFLSTFHSSLLAKAQAAKIKTLITEELVVGINNYENDLGKDFLGGSGGNIGYLKSKDGLAAIFQAKWKGPYVSDELQVSPWGAGYLTDRKNPNIYYYFSYVYPGDSWESFWPNAKYPPQPTDGGQIGYRVIVMNNLSIEVAEQLQRDLGSQAYIQIWEDYGYVYYLTNNKIFIW